MAKEPLKPNNSIRVTYVSTEFKGAIRDKITGELFWLCEHQHKDALEAIACANHEQESRLQALQELTDAPVKVKIPMI